MVYKLEMIKKISLHTLRTKIYHNVVQTCLRFQLPSPLMVRAQQFSVQRVRRPPSYKTRDGRETRVPVIQKALHSVYLCGPGSLTTTPSVLSLQHRRSTKTDRASCRYCSWSGITVFDNQALLNGPGSALSSTVRRGKWWDAHATFGTTPGQR